jgi:hypothetical protein
MVYTRGGEGCAKGLSVIEDPTRRFRGRMSPRRSGAMFATMMAVLGLTLSTAWPAVAGTHAVADPRGDAPARADILRITVIKTSTVVTAKVKVRKLRRGNSVGVDYSFKGDDAATQALVHRTAAGQLVSRLVYYRESQIPIPCPGQRARWRKAKHLVIVTTPLSCFTGAEGFGFGNRAAGVAYRNVPSLDYIFYPSYAADHTRYFHIG